MFRLPCHLVDISEWNKFFISKAIETTFYSDRKNFSLDFNFHGEGYYGWVDGDGYLDGLQSLRDDIIAGDFRVLYLAWLKACQQFMCYIELDGQLVKASAQNSPRLVPKNQEPINS